MRLTIQIKQLGRKRSTIGSQEIDIDSADIISLRELLLKIVEVKVNEFNNKPTDIEEKDTTHSPQNNYLHVLTETGKAGFGNIYNEKKANLEKAQENSLLSFQDGLFAVFYGDDELSDLETTIDLSLYKPLSFIRLTFLTGSFW